MANEELFKKIISHAKEYGFVFPSSEIYDGLSAVYDYGPFYPTPLLIYLIRTFIIFSIGYYPAIPALPLPNPYFYVLILTFLK